MMDNKSIIASFIYGTNESEDAVFDAVLAAFRALNKAKLTPLAYNVALTILASYAREVIDTLEM